MPPLKHRWLYKDTGWHIYEPMLSPLYRLRRVKEEEMSEEDECLLKLSKMISGSEEKAEMVWNNWPSSHVGDGIRWEEVLDVFEKIG